MVAVTELGYVGIGVKSLSEWQDFAAEVLGMEVVDEGEAGRSYLRMDYWHHRLIVDEDGSDDITVLGFRVEGGDEFAQMQRQLADSGISFEVAGPEQAQQRRVLELMRLTDPAGVPLEIFHGPLVQPHKPFHPGRGIHGRFVTGTGGVGHCILRHESLDDTYRFYQALGMRGGIEYRVPRPDGGIGEVMFMHCNDRDHSVAFGPPSHKRINHLMVEFDNLDDIGLTYEIVQQKKLPVTILPGRHANDHMYSFYFTNPSGWMCEIGYGGRPATHQSEYYERDSWGHDFVGVRPDMSTD